MRTGGLARSHRAALLSQSRLVLVTELCRSISRSRSITRQSSIRIRGLSSKRTRQCWPSQNDQTSETFTSTVWTMSYERKVRCSANVLPSSLLMTSIRHSPQLQSLRSPILTSSKKSCKKMTLHGKTSNCRKWWQTTSTLSLVNGSP